MTSTTTSNTPSATHPGVEASSSHSEFAALLQSAGVAPLDQTGWLRVTGSDRLRWLNGMASNSVQDLDPGAGAYNFFLNAQGRIQADGYILATPDALLIETSCRLVPQLIP